MISTPDSYSPSSLRIVVIGGPDIEGLDRQVSMTLAEDALERLTDDDVQALIEVAANRLLDGNPGWIVQHHLEWSGGTLAEPPVTDHNGGEA